MRHKVFAFAMVALSALVAAGVYWEKICDAGKEDLLNEVVTIEGKVEILNHPDLGRTPASLTTIIFQRVDCGKCLIAARTDE